MKTKPRKKQQNFIPYYRKISLIQGKEDFYVQYIIFFITLLIEEEKKGGGIFIFSN